MQTSETPISPKRIHWKTSSLYGKLFFTVYTIVASVIFYGILEFSFRVGSVIYHRDLSSFWLSQKRFDPLYMFAPTTGDRNKHWIIGENYPLMRPCQGPIETRYYRDSVPFFMYTNDFGFRGRGFSEPKPANVIRVITLGGSSTYGVESNEMETWPAYLERYVNDQLTQKDTPLHVEIVNGGFPAANMGSIYNLYRDVETPIDYLVLYSGVNNSFLNPDFMKSTRIINTIGYFFYNHSKLYRYLKTRSDRYFKPKLMYPKYAMYNENSIQVQMMDQYFDNILDLTEKRQAKMLVVIQVVKESISRLTPPMHRSKCFSDFLRKKCSAPNISVTLCDPTPTFQQCVDRLDPSDYSDPYDYLFHDIVHLKPEGNNLLAQIISDSLVSMILTPQQDSVTKEIQE